MWTSRLTVCTTLVGLVLVLALPVRGGVVHRQNVNALFTTIGGVFDMDGNGTFDFRFYTGGVLDSTGVSIKGTSDSNGIVSPDGLVFAQSLTLDTQVGLDNQLFENSAALNVLLCEGSRACLYATTLDPEDDGLFYIGVEFERFGENRYGMIGFEMSSLNGSVLIEEVFYETTPNTLLTVPPAGTLGVLPAGLVVLRRRR